MPLPLLHKGPYRLETISKPPPIVRHFKGDLAVWDDFHSNAIKFLQDDRVRKEFERCAHAPIYMDPKIEKLNSKAMAFERLRSGAEITLSGRFFWNLLAVVLHVVETLTSPEHGQRQNPGLLPLQLTFGDSWIIDKPYRVNRQQPDVVLELLTGTGHRLRLVGELKFCVAVSFKDMVKDAESGKAQRFKGILGKLHPVLPSLRS